MFVETNRTVRNIYTRARGSPDKTAILLLVSELRMVKVEQVVQHYKLDGSGPIFVGILKLKF